MNPITKIRAALGDLGSMVKERVDRREKLLQRVDELHALPPRKEDILAALHRTVDTGAEDFNDRLRTHLHSIIKHQDALEGVPGHFPLLAPNSGRGWQDVLGVAIYGLFGVQLKEALVTIVANMSWPEVGPPLVERRVEIEKIGKELARIDSELEELQASATAAGVSLPGYVPKSKKG